MYKRFSYSYAIKSPHLSFNLVSGDYMARRNIVHSFLKFVINLLLCHTSDCNRFCRRKLHLKGNANLIQNDLCLSFVSGSTLVYTLAVLDAVLAMIITPL